MCVYSNLGHQIKLLLTVNSIHTHRAESRNILHWSYKGYEARVQNSFEFRALCSSAKFTKMHYFDNKLVKNSDFMSFLCHSLLDNTFHFIIHSKTQVHVALICYIYRYIAFLHTQLLQSHFLYIQLLQTLVQD